MMRLQKGRHIPDISTLRRMAEELDVPLHYFFCEDDVSAELVCAVDKLSNEDKLDLIDALKKKSNV